MNQASNDVSKFRGAVNSKITSTNLNKNVNLKKKGSGCITPLLKQQFFRPKSTVADLSQKQGSTGISSSNSNKNFFQSQKLSPKQSIGDLKQIIKQRRKGPSSRSKDKRITNVGSSRKIGQVISPSRKPIQQKNKEQIKKNLANIINIYYPPDSKPQLMNTIVQSVHIQKVQKAPLSKGDFNFIDIIGQGGYGKVWKVQHKKSRKLFAMKQMSKAVIIMKKSVESVQNQRKLLSKLRHSFIANIIAAFHDRDNLYLVMDLMTGCDLRYHIGQKRQFSEQQTRFFIACIIIGLEYLHSKKIIHRDIKPQNLVLDSNGYLRITDLGIARLQKQNNDKDTSGTPGYMAPQVLCKQSHSYLVDFFAVGVITYQFMLGRRPYVGKSRNDIRQAILAKQVQIKKSQIPAGWSVQAVDFTNKLIQRQTKCRLGNRTGIQQIKQHPWLKKYPWKKLLSKELKSPFILNGGQYMVSEQSQGYTQQLMQYKILQRLQDHKDLFADYEYRGNEL